MLAIVIMTVFIDFFTMHTKSIYFSIICLCNVHNLIDLVDLAGDYHIVKEAFDNAVRETGPLYLFINCAGMAICGTLEDISPSSILVLFYNKIIMMIIIDYYVK